MTRSAQSHADSVVQSSRNIPQTPRRRVDNGTNDEDRPLMTHDKKTARPPGPRAKRVKVKANIKNEKRDYKHERFHKRPLETTAAGKKTVIDCSIG